jgi:hypothetical protein
MEMGHCSTRENVPSIGHESANTNHRDETIKVICVDNHRVYVITSPEYSGFFVAGKADSQLFLPPEYYGGGCKNGNDYMHGLLSVRLLSGNMIPCRIYELLNANGGTHSEVAYMSASGCIINGAPLNWPNVFFPFAFPDNDTPAFFSVGENVLGTFPRVDPDYDDDECFNRYPEPENDESFSRKRKRSSDPVDDRDEQVKQRYKHSFPDDPVCPEEEHTSEWVAWPFTNSNILATALSNNKAIVTYASKTVVCSTPDNDMFAFIVLSVKNVWDETRYIVLLVLPAEKTHALQITLAQHYARATKDAEKMLTYIGTDTTKVYIPSATHSCILLPLPAKWVNPEIVWAWIDLFLPLEYNILSNQSSYDNVALGCSMRVVDEQ